MGDADSVVLLEPLIENVIEPLRVELLLDDTLCVPVPVMDDDIDVLVDTELLKVSLPDDVSVMEPDEDAVIEVVAEELALTESDTLYDKLIDTVNDTEVLWDADNVTEDVPEILVDKERESVSELEPVSL